VELLLGCSIDESKFDKPCPKASFISQQIYIFWCSLLLPIQNGTNVQKRELSASLKVNLILEIVQKQDEAFF